MGLSVVILAAGNGKRMESSIPKVLHPIGGMPMLERVVKTAMQLNPDQIHVVHGNGSSTVQSSLSHLSVHWVKQKEQLGTGHAVLQAMPFCKDDDQILILYGDVPLISLHTLTHLIQDTIRNGIGLVVTEMVDPTGFGRIIRNEMGNITAIVEHKDANEEQLKIKEINTGILMASAKHLKAWLPNLKTQNTQGEYYLTDIVTLAVEDSVPVGGVMAYCTEEVQGVNDRWQQAALERYYQLNQAKQLCYAGVTVLDPHRLEVRGEVDIAQDVVLDVNVVLEGVVKIGEHCRVGPNVVLKNVELGNHVNIHANTVIEDAKIADHCAIGPFSRIRPGSVLEAGVKVGNFVEVKKSYIGAGSKASHLSYLGDVTIGKSVNIGAGVITCNYDGVNKWPTTIGDNAFIGSNSSLVAPLKIGNNATIGASSVIAKDAPADHLTLSTNLTQRTIKDWQRPVKKIPNNSTKVKES